MSLRLLWVYAGAVVLSAQPPADFEASVKAAMAPSIAQQRSAVRQQVAALGAAAPASSPQSFFTTPFSLAAFSRASGASADCDPLPSEQLESIVQQAARKSGVDAQLVRAVIDQESAGRPCALSARGAQGLMQLMPATAEKYDVDDPFDPQQNVEAGTRLLRSLLDRYRNDASLALGAYNAGAGRVDQAGAVPAIPETMDYVTAILEKLGFLTRGEHAGSQDKTAPATRSIDNSAIDNSAIDNSAMDNSGWQIPPPSVIPPPSLKDF